MRRLASLALLVGAAAVCAGCAGDPPGVNSRSASQAEPTAADATSIGSTPPSAPSLTSPSSAPATPATAPATSPATSPATGSTPPPATGATTVARPASMGDPQVAAELVGTFDAPVSIAVRPGDPALYVVEQPGRIVRVADAQPTVVADLTALTNADGERGLLGLAFSPDGSLAWVHYTSSGGAIASGDTVVAEYPVDSSGTFAVDAARLVFTVDQPYANHNGGDLAVGPDGMLYIALGDGGSADDPERRASDPANLLGKILRIDPRPALGSAYLTPADNPFAVETTDSGGAPEVWALGLRNPWRIAFDPVTGDLWIADVGQNEIEEVNVVSPAGGAPAGRGADFGWSAYEGEARFNDDVADSGTFVFPVVTYRHGDDGCSVSGGAVYRGTWIPALEPAFVYGDYCSGKLWAFDRASGRNVLLLDVFERLSAVRAGPGGELYVLELSGDVYRLVPRR